VKVILIHEKIRQNLLDELFGVPYRFEGRLNTTTFLKRFMLLDKKLEKDIVKNVENYSNWREEHLYYVVLNILSIEDETFLGFINELVHPAVREYDEESQALFLSVINKHLSPLGYQLQEVDSLSGSPVYKAIKKGSVVKGSIKNLIFSADGPKPEIVIEDSIENNIKIVSNEKFCLVYEFPSQVAEGLTWNDLVSWWANREGLEMKESQKSLYRRLRKSLKDSPPEQLLFKTYFEAFHEKLGDKLPALIPQVYLHYDPYTVKQLKGKVRLDRQRMDFLILFSNSDRVVIEVDGKQHYSVADKPSPELYSKMVSADRDLKLMGYQLFRFGGYELQEDEGGAALVIDFFERLFAKYGIKL
jgi:very-short-patch-repair endonuclease